MIASIGWKGQWSSPQQLAYAATLPCVFGASPGPQSTPKKALRHKTLSLLRETGRSC